MPNRSVTWLLLLLATVPATADERWDNSVAIAYVHPEKGASQSARIGSIRLTTKTVPMHSTDSIESLLREQGIAPDGESYEAFYRLNPEYAVAGPPLNSNVIVPSAQASDEWLQRRAEGYLLALTLDVDEKRKLLEQISRIGQRAAFAAQALAATIPDPASRERLLKDIGVTMDTFNAVASTIRERTLPLDPEMLSQVRSEADLFEASLAISPGESNPGYYTRFALIAQDMAIHSNYLRGTKAAGATPTPRTKVRVQVRTFAAGKKSEQSGLRIHYTPAALYGTGKDVQTFPQLTPGEQYLMEANYRIWATSAASDVPITDIPRIELRLQPDPVAAVAVDLVVIGTP